MSPEFDSFNCLSSNSFIILNIYLLNEISSKLQSKVLSLKADFKEHYIKKLNDICQEHDLKDHPLSPQSLDIVDLDTKNCKLGSYNPTRDKNRTYNANSLNETTFATKFCSESKILPFNEDIEMVRFDDQNQQESVQVQVGLDIPIQD